MALTRSFRSLVAARIEREPAFRQALLAEAMNRLLDAETDQILSDLPGPEEQRKVRA